MTAVDEPGFLEQEEQEIKALEDLIAAWDAEEEERYADQLAAARAAMHKPILLTVDEVYLRRRYLIARYESLMRAAGRSSACRAVLASGLEHADGVTARDLAAELDLPVDVVRAENQALKRMGLAASTDGLTARWEYSVSRS